MKIRRQFAFLFIALFCSSYAFGDRPRKTGLTVAVTYEGGTLPWSQGKVKATLAEDELVLYRGSRKVAVPLENIAAVSCGTDVRRRFGAAVLAVVPRMHLDTAEEHYVGLTWSADDTPKVEAVLKLNNAEYHDFLTALERLTGRKAVDTQKIGTSVKY